MGHVGEKTLAARLGPRPQAASPLFFDENARRFEGLREAPLRRAGRHRHVEVWPGEFTSPLF